MSVTQITTKDFPVSHALDTEIRRKTEKLDRFCRNIMSCRVVIGIQQKHKHQGKLYNVRIDLTVPGKEFAVTHKRDQDVYVALRDAFKALERQLEEYGRKRNGHVKAHNDVSHGHVVRLVKNEGYGFIDGVDGNEYYFSLTNVAYPNFAQLMIGDAVEYIPTNMKDGRQAHHVVKERHNNHHVVA